MASAAIQVSTHQGRGSRPRLRRSAGRSLKASRTLRATISRDPFPVRRIPAAIRALLAWAATTPISPTVADKVGVAEVVAVGALRFHDAAASSPSRGNCCDFRDFKSPTMTPRAYAAEGAST